MSQVQAPALGWDSRQRRWTAASTSDDWHPADIGGGELLIDPDTLDHFAESLGRRNHARPMAVYQPRTTQDVAALIRFCGRHGIRVAARGTQHSTGTQGLGADVHIDMRTMTAIHEVTDRSITADAGVTLRQLAETAWCHQRRLAGGTTGYTRLTSGGVLSVGGFSPGAWRDASLGEAALGAEVVIGTGEILDCGPTYNPWLWKVIRGGLGQFGIVTRIQWGLRPAPQLVTTRTRTFRDPTDLLTCARTLMHAGHDGVWARWQQPDQLELRVETHHHDDTADLPPLDGPPDSSLTLPYLDHVRLFDEHFYDPLIQRSWATWRKDWRDVLVDDTQIDGFLQAAFRAQRAHHFRSPGAIAILMPKSRRASTSALPLPAGDSERMWLVDWLLDDGGEDWDDMNAWAADLTVAARSVGAVAYHIGNITLKFDEHYRPAAPLIRELRDLVDPHALFGHGLWTETPSEPGSSTAGG
ncbi:FAD-binding oxidoreductase [Saccharopolyspora shandongensis]|uniref:FAD-binding oxidoreductase n=1 Tax=Saccharopolyspora shandongensis TaxID=418495 RepID=UPI0034149898